MPFSYCDIYLLYFLRWLLRAVCAPEICKTNEMNEILRTEKNYHLQITESQIIRH